MSVDKLVDSTQLDSDLTSVANAIRTKGGTSASLAFPADFVTAIGAIPNTYSAGDEGKVVSNGALVAQSSDSVTQNGTVDTTLINSLTVNVSGSSGLEYESGTYTPTSDISRPQIDFSRTHSDYPVLIVMADQNDTYATNQGTNTLFVYFDPYRFFGKGFTYNTSSERYAVVYYSYQSSSSSSNGAVLMQHSSDETESSDDTSYPRYWVQKYRFYPYSNSTSRYWRKNRTYKWIAIWKPTT